MITANVKPGKLFIISSPTGGGKTTIVTAVLNRLQGEIPIRRIVTSTTRQPRCNEINEVDYNFITKDEFIKQSKAGKFLETNEFAGEFYGSPISIIADLKAGKTLIIITDRLGAESLQLLIPESVLIWITVSDIKLIKERLRKRDELSKTKTEHRGQIAQKEFEQEKMEHFFKYHVLNDVLEDAIQQTISIIKTELAC